MKLHLQLHSKLDKMQSMNMKYMVLPPKMNSNKWKSCMIR